MKICIGFQVCGVFWLECEIPLVIGSDGHGDGGGWEGQWGGWVEAQRAILVFYVKNAMFRGWIPSC